MTTLPSSLCLACMNSYECHLVSRMHTSFSVTDGHGLLRPSWHFHVFGWHPDHQQQPRTAFAAHPSAVRPSQAIWSGGKTGQVHFLHSGNRFPWPSHQLPRRDPAPWKSDQNAWLYMANYCSQLAGVCGNGKLLPPIHPSCSSANAATRHHILGQSAAIKTTHSPLLDRGHVAGFQHNQASAGWCHHASTSTAWCSDCTLCGHLQHSSWWCPQTVCQWHMAATCLFQPHAMTAQNQVQHFQLWIARLLPWHLPFSILLGGSDHSRSLQTTSH